MQTQIAVTLADLVGTKTLTVCTLRQAKAMGFALTYVDRFGACNELADRTLAILAN